MDFDERIVNYMKVRSEYAKTVAFVAAAQLFAVAGFYCMYALYSGGVFYSGSLTYAKITILSIMVLVSIGLCVVNVFTVMKGKMVDIKYPDFISTRQGEEVVREAYMIARPVLIQKITVALLGFPIGILVNIILRIYVNQYKLASIYGMIAILLATAVFISVALPCIDRINCYRALLNEIHVYVDLKLNSKKKFAFGYIFAVGVPLCVCIWGLLRFYSRSQDIAFITFPISLLLCLSACFLAGWCIEKPQTEVTKNC